MKYKKQFLALLALLAFGFYACEGGGLSPFLDAIDGPSNDAPHDGDSIDPEDGVAPDSDSAERPDGSICTPGETKCDGSIHKKCNATGLAWVDTTCGEGTICTKEGCVSTICTPNTVECNDAGQRVVCNIDGTAYSTPTDCDEGYACVSGQCLPMICTPGTTACTATSILSCEGEPPQWVETECEENEICFKGSCVECLIDDHCPGSLVCNADGKCIAEPLSITTKDLDVGQIQQPYSMQIEARGGDKPYSWSLDAGTLPAGINLAANGTLAGKPTEIGSFELTITVTDDAGATASKDFMLQIVDDGLTITSRSPLPDCEEGTPYSFTFQAIGGSKPYAWNVRAGAVPDGLVLTANGTLAGTPVQHGQFDFTMRVVDDQPTKAEADFHLTCKIAPLQIIGDKSYNVFVTKIVILPMITVVEGIPIPYSTQLQAKGGVKPYHWKESEMSGLIKTLIPKAGIPQGLTLADDGKLSGAVTDTSQVFELQVPLMPNLPKLTGFFFMAEVTDSQSPADSDQAIFLIPTIPIDFGGGGGLF